VWFEAFPLVYIDIHHFTLGESGLPFLGLMAGTIFASAGYVCWNYFYVEPQFKKTGKFVPESRLLVALVASAFIPVSLLIFGTCLRA
jgi:DHA1 family multidrug resistance protein-like MFS transporter